MTNSNDNEYLLKISDQNRIIYPDQNLVNSGFSSKEIERMKIAFYKIFDKQGEFWFGNKNDNHDYVSYYFKEFIEYLEKNDTSTT